MTETLAAVQRVAILWHPKLERATSLADEVRQTLDGHVDEIVSQSVWDTEPLHDLLPCVDIAIVLGGDGSILRAARIAAFSQTPILGINLGRLGFLAELEPEEIQTRLLPTVTGQGWVEERIMLQIEHWRDDEKLGTYQALNEAVVGRRSLSRVVRVHVTFDDLDLSTYKGDGVMVATPTGSTAYSYSAGGPILHPEVHSLLLTPICARARSQGSLVIKADTVVRLRARTDHEAALSIDGQGDVLMLDGDTVVVTMSQHRAHFLRTQNRDYFYQTLLTKMGI